MAVSVLGIRNPVENKKGRGLPSWRLILEEKILM